MHYHNAALKKLCYTASTPRFCPSAGADPQLSAACAKAACFHLPSCHLQCVGMAVSLAQCGLCPYWSKGCSVWLRGLGKTEIFALRMKDWWGQIHAHLGRLEAEITDPSIATDGSECVAQHEGTAGKGWDANTAHTAQSSKLTHIALGRLGRFPTEGNKGYWGLLRGFVTKSHFLYSWKTLRKDLRKTSKQSSVRLLIHSDINTGLKVGLIPKL